MLICSIEIEGFVLVLVSLLRNRDYVDPAVRLMAATQIKTVVRKYWTSHSTMAFRIQDAEKARLRAELLTLLDEPDKAIATQIALIIAKISRTDAALEWYTDRPTH